MMFNWGIVGTGWIASDMADALNKENGSVYAVINPNKPHTDEFAEKKKVEHVYYDYAEFLSDPNLDIVYIATPHHLHYEQIKQALEAGKHVFCEKAMTINAQEFDEVAALAREKSLILVEGFTLYHMPLYKEILDKVQTGEIGDIKMIQVNFGSLKDLDPTNRYFNKDLAGGALLDIGGYAIAFATMFLDGHPRVAQTSVEFYETGVDEMSGIILKNECQQMAVISLSFRAKQPKRGVISGTKGYIEIDNYPRADKAMITYTEDAHTQRSEIFEAGASDDALIYEIRDMERYIEQGCDDGDLIWSEKVSHILDDVRRDWGMHYPFEN